jgi:hypothetical protein
MERTTQQHQPTPRERPEERPERRPIWSNTRPRANPVVDRQDVNRGVERLEAVLGR